MLVRRFHLHRFASSVRPPFVAHPLIGTTIFVCLYIFLICAQLTVFTSSCLQTKASRPLTSARCLRENHIRFRWFHTCAGDLGPPVFFPWTLCLPSFLLLFLFPLSFPKNLPLFIYNLDLMYHVTKYKMYENLLFVD